MDAEKPKIKPEIRERIAGGEERIARFPTTYDENLGLEPDPDEMLHIFPQILKEEEGGDDDTKSNS